MTSSNWTFCVLPAICAGNSPVHGEFPHKGQWRGALMFSLICARINGWVNNREAGDLIRHRAHYDVIVMDDMTWKRFSHYWPVVRENTGDPWILLTKTSHVKLWCFPLLLVWISCWAKCWVAGDLRHHVSWSSIYIIRSSEPTVPHLGTI